MIVTSLTSLGRKCRNEPDMEDGVGVAIDGAEERNDGYQKLMSKLITRYIDDRDEFADMDAALRIQFERLTNKVDGLKAEMKAEKEIGK